MSPFSIIPIAAIGLIIVFFLSLYSRYAGFGIRAFCLWLSLIPAFLAGAAWVGMQGCTALFKGSLRILPEKTRTTTIQPDPHNESPYWSGYDIVARVVYLFPSIGIILVDLENSTYRSVPLLHIAGQALPFLLGLEAIIGILWFAAPCLVGLFLADMLGITPNGARLMPHIGKRLRLVLGTFAVLLFLLTIVDVAYFYGYGQAILEGYAKTHPNLVVFGIPLTYLPLYISQVLGLVTAIDTIIAILGVIVGICGLLTLLIGLLYCMFFILHLAFTILGVIIATFGGVYEKLPWIALTPFPPRQPEAFSGISSQAQIGVSVQQKPVGATSERSEKLLPAPRKESTMDTRLVTLFGVDPEGTRMVAAHAEAVEIQQLAKYYRGWGYVDPTKSLKQHARTYIQGATPIGINQADIDAVVQSVESIEVDAELLHKVEDRIVQLNQPRSFGILELDISPRILIEAIPRIKDIKRRVDSETIIVTVPLLEAYKMDKTMRAVYRTLATLDEASLVLLYDTRSPFAMKQTEPVQLRAIAHILSRFFVGDTYSDHNPPFPQIADDLGRVSKLVALSSTTVGVSAGETPFGWRVATGVMPKLPAKGNGSLKDLKTQTEVAIDAVIQAHDTRFLNVAVDTTKPCFVQLGVPIAQSDPKFLEFDGQIRRSLALKYQHATGVVVRGSRIPGIQIEGEDPYACTVSSLYPVDVNTLFPEA